MKVEEISKAKWQSYLKKQKYVSLFEFPLWYAIWEDYFETTTTTYLLDGYLIISCFHLKGAKGFVAFNNSSPAGTYANFRSIKGARHLTSEDFATIQKITRVNYLRLSPFSNVSISSDVVVTEKDFTQIINISELDKIKQYWSRNHKRMYRKALDSNLTVVKTNDQIDWEDYFELYMMFADNKGNKSSTAYKSQLFKSIFTIETMYRDLWIVKKQDKLIAGRLVFYTKDYAVEWHASSLLEANTLGANQLLIHHILNDAKSRGIVIYDFNPSDGHEGVIAFKEKFGAIPTDSKVYKSYNQIQKLYLKTR